MVRYNNLQKPTERKELPKKAQFPTLTDFAIDVVSSHFEYYPHLQGIPEQYREKVSHSALQRWLKILPRLSQKLIKV